MTVAAHKETLDFQTEIRQLLKLMVHSLYSNKEIFLRELISNSADACDKLRFEALTDDALYEDNGTFKIQVSYDKDKRIITVSDNGIGMSRQEVMENLGTIAKSGTRQFLEALSGDQAKDMKLIGQFGVGFYSGFIVADRIAVLTRRAGLGAEHGVRWESDGEGSYTLETVVQLQRGTEVTLHLREGEDEFLDGSRLRNVIRKYSDHIPFPIVMQRESEGGGEETVNRASALWANPKKNISVEDYHEFYKHLAHDFEEPLAYAHNHVEGSHSYTALFYIPQRAPFDLWNRHERHGIKLYVRRVYIMDAAEQLLPHYLRFVRGLIDSDDLPLNISREILQHNRHVEAIRTGSIKRILSLLEELSKEHKEKYAQFWREFGRALKEGPAEDPGNRERIAKLLRFTSTYEDGDAQTVSLDDYLARFKENQSKIYYLTADSYNAARHSPHLEVFRQNSVEVLLLSDPIDEWLVSHLREYAGKPLQSVAKGELDLDALKLKEKNNNNKEIEDKYKDVLERMKQALGDQVKTVRPSHRLIDSPVCLVSEEQDLGVGLRKILEAAGQRLPNYMPTLEVNMTHPLIQRLQREKDEHRFRDWSQVLFEQAVLAEGGRLEDPASFVRRLNGLLLLLAD